MKAGSPDSAFTQNDLQALIKQKDHLLSLLSGDKASEEHTEPSSMLLLDHPRYMNLLTIPIYSNLHIYRNLDLYINMPVPDQESLLNCSNRPDHSPALLSGDKASEERAESSSILLLNNHYYMLFTESTVIDDSPTLFSASKSREKSRTSLDMDSGYVKMGSNTQELLAQPTDIDYSGNESGEERTKKSISMFFSSPSNTDSDNLILTTGKESKSVLGKISG